MPFMRLTGKTPTHPHLVFQSTSLKSSSFSARTRRPCLVMTVQQDLTSPVQKVCLQLSQRTLTTYLKLGILHCFTIFRYSSLLGYTLRCFGEVVATGLRSIRCRTRKPACNCIPPGVRKCFSQTGERGKCQFRSGPSGTNVIENVRVRATRTRGICKISP